MSSKSAIICKSPARVSMKKLGIDRDMIAILYHDFLSFYDNPAPGGRKVIDSSTQRPFLAIPTCSVRALQSQSGDTSVVMTVWETDLSLNLPTTSVALVWHYELSCRVAVVDRTFGSFATPKPCPDKCLELYHCGQEYYSALADALEAATTCIMITGWWFSPQIYLKRDTFPLPQKYRLDNLLQAKAQAGVKVYIIVFKENELAINLGSRLAKTYMESLDRNISMLLHGPPNWAKVWYSHHQKTVVVDQHIGFIGGIDLCFGRYDTTSHPLADLTPPYTFIGADYYNQFQIAVSGPAMAKPFLDIMDKDKPMRETMPREPWNDVHAKVVGGAARDIAMNFMQRWAAHNLAAGTPYEPSMTISPIPVPIPNARPEPPKPPSQTYEVEDEANVLRFGDQIRLWAWSPACPEGVAGGYVGIDKKHKLCGLGPGSADRFGPSSFRVVSIEDSTCTKVGCTGTTDHPEVRVCPKHVDSCHALSCSKERLHNPESDYCADHHFSAAERSLAPPVLYGDKLVLVNEKRQVWNNDARTWFQGYIKFGDRGIEGEMYVTFLNNPNLPAKASKPINFYDSGVSIKVVSSHRASVDLDNVITLYPKHKTQGFIGCTGGSPLTFTIHHAGPSEAAQKELDSLTARIQQLQIKTRVLKDGAGVTKPGPARDKLMRDLEEAEKALVECIEERRHPKWRFSSSTEVGAVSRNSIESRGSMVRDSAVVNHRTSGSRASLSRDSALVSANRESTDELSAAPSPLPARSLSPAPTASPTSHTLPFEEPSSCPETDSSDFTISHAASAPSSPHSPPSALSTSISAPSLLREEENSERQRAHEEKHHLSHYLTAPPGGKVRMHIPHSGSLPRLGAPEVTRTCQVLRSLTNTWSGGTFRESSILAGYLHAIAESKRFIYIEQQFFVSSLDDPSHPVRNLVAKALFDRISQAILDHEIFSVVVVLPISPEGALQDRSVRLVMHYQRCSIDRGKFSLMKQLEARFKDVQMSNYLNFYGLRTYDPSVLDAKGRPRTMQIYVHSKLLIADDRVMILGSANINDRSLSGNRDSEICIRVEEPVGCTLNSIQRFRRKLWANYLAVDDVDFEEGSIQADMAQAAGSPRPATSGPGKPATSGPKLEKPATEPEKASGHGLRATLHKVDARVQERLHKVEEKVQESLHKAEAMLDKVRHKTPKPPDRLSLEDAASLEVQTMWKSRATTNTAAYQACFPNLPHSSIKTHLQLTNFNSQAGNPEVLAAVKGYVVHFPRLFLEDETLLPDLFDKENLVPADCFT